MRKYFVLYKIFFINLVCNLAQKNKPVRVYFILGRNEYDINRETTDVIKIT